MYNNEETHDIVHAVLYGLHCGLNSYHFVNNLMLNIHKSPAKQQPVDNVHMYMLFHRI